MFTKERRPAARDERVFDAGVQWDKVQADESAALYRKAVASGTADLRSLLGVGRRRLLSASGEEC